MILDEQTATREITQRSDEALTQLKSELADIEKQRKNVALQHAIIGKLRESRNATLQRNQELVTQLEAKHNQAAQYAKLSHETVRETESIKAASEAKNKWLFEKTAFERLQHDSAEDEKQQEQHAIALTDQLQMYQSEGARIQAEIDGIEAAKHQAHEDLGMKFYNEFLKTYQQKQGRVEKLTDQLLTAKSELIDSHTAALEKLQAWPDLHKALVAMQEPDNATIRMVKASIAYLEVFLADAAEVKMPFEPSLRMDDMILGDKIPEVIQCAYAAKHTEYQNGLHVSNMGSKYAEIRTRISLLQQFLDAYQEKLRSDV